MFFDDWHDLARIVAVGAPAYAWLILILRVTGKRTLSKMNAFDFVITVALGSTFATILLNRDVSLVEGAFALGLLCGLQFLVAFLCVRSPRFEHAVKSEPRLLFHQGRYLRDAMRRERVTEDELLAALRGSGHASLEEVQSIVLETDGTFSVLPPGPAGEALRHVRS
jgi:uncharacterized membrane protein YcaP (DUF421 family)